MFKFDVKSYWNPLLKEPLHFVKFMTLDTSRQKTVDAFVNEAFVKST
jgi:hypothetical protein